MGMYDTVMVACPKCGYKHNFQSKSGECLFDVYELENCPDDVFADINRHSPYKCDCGTSFEVDMESRNAIIVEDGSEHCA